MSPGRSGLIVRGIFFEQLDVRCQSRAREQPFKQIVAQQSIFLNFACQGMFERVNIINSFSRVRTFPE